MDIMELDEAQGLTAEMVRRYMTRTGWRPAESTTYECWIHDTLKPSAAGVFVLREKIDGAWSRITAEDLAIYVRDLASLEGRTVQSLLREINPRMRAGLPTQAELDAHRGFWIGHMGGKYPMPSVGYFQPLIGGMEWRSGNAVWDMDALEQAAQSEYPCAFWPCDQHGNKTRRGA